MSEDRRNYMAGLISDLGFSFVTYIVLATILGICAIALRPEVEQFVGQVAASIWWVLIAFGFSVRQFLKLRRLRLANSDFTKISG
jgi:hypothetical protein